MSDHDPLDPAFAGQQPSRRTAIQIFTGFLGVLLNVVPAGMAGLFFLDPLFGRKKKGGDATSAGPEGSVLLSVTVDVIPNDGTPVAVTVKADLVDAWNMYPDEPIGSIWLRRQPDGSILALNSTCPHLGCSVDYRNSDRDFYCPCHTSAFTLSGEPTNKIPPRAMDTLEIITATDGKPDEAGRELWLRYQDFKGATSEKVPV